MEASQAQHSTTSQHSAAQPSPTRFRPLNSYAHAWKPHVSLWMFRLHIGHLARYVTRSVATMPTGHTTRPLPCASHLGLWHSPLMLRPCVTLHHSGASSENSV